MPKLFMVFWSVGKQGIRGESWDIDNYFAITNINIIIIIIMIPFKYKAWLS